MDFEIKKDKHDHLYLKYTMIFIFIALFVYGTYFITGHSLIWYIDGASQHLPLLQEFRADFFKFLHHPSLDTWSFHLGLGSDKFQIYSYYLLGDVFAYLAILFPASKIILTYQLMIILRLYCAGLAFCWCARHFKLKNVAIITGAIVYIFNAFLLYSNVAQPFFTLPFIIFPILIVNLERVLQNHSAWPLMLTFTWMLINNFYFAYILGLGAIIYLVLRLFWTRHEKKNYLKLFAKLAWASLLAILNSAILLLPEFIAVQNSTRAGSKFANGLSHYPLYYYLNLPGQLINGGNRDFYFWSALGFASLALFALIYSLYHFKKYPIINSSFILGFVMLLFPACAAVFNGFMAPSNRWTLLLCLPISLSCAILIENLNTISSRLIQLFILISGAYLVYITIDYLFQNNEKLFVPVIFLLLTLVGFIFIYHYHPRHARQIFLGLTMCNVIFNAIYFEAPYNGGYADEMLPFGSYEKLTHSEYSDLTHNLVNNNEYRTSTISQNQVLGNQFPYYNNLDPKINDISSYYSLQNKYVGDFAIDLQNTQFEANFPIRQFDDRSVINNFLGVKYLFVQSGEPNSKKIPATYQLDALNEQNTYNNQQILRYKSDYAFPLVYWQNKIFTPKEYAKLSATQKERALVDGVLIDQPTNLKHASVKNEVISLPFKIISSNGNEINPNHIENLDSKESYQIIIDQNKLTKEQKQALKHCELHLEFENLKYQPLTLLQQVKLQQTNADYQLSNGILTQNSALNWYKYWRKNIIKGTPNSGFTIEATTNLGTESIKQPKPYILSFFKVVKNGTMNLGYFNNDAPKTIDLNLKELGTYSFKLNVVAEKMGTTYKKQVQNIQNHALQDAHYTDHGFSGKITTNQAGILTSSIPYSSGWSAKVNGKKQPILKTNQAFLGLKLDKGNHHIVFTYQTPGLKLGILISLIGISLSLICWGITIFLKNKK